MSKKTKTEDMEEKISEEQITQEEQQIGNNSEDQDTDAEINAIETLEEELAKEKDKFLRLFAEFENYKKRTSKERMDLFKTAGQEVMTALLPVLDDFERALKEIAKSEDKEMFKGVELIDIKFRETLKAKGLEEIKIKEGDAFDPEVRDIEQCVFARLQGFQSFDAALAGDGDEIGCCGHF